MPFESIFTSFVMMWAVVDPVGTLPVFLSATRAQPAKERNRIARLAVMVAGGILLFFLLVGELLLDAMSVSMEAFQVAGGIVLFLFALSMIFGESKPEAEMKSVPDARDVAIFPLATPSLASPGAMMAVVLLTENAQNSFVDQFWVGLIMCVVLACAYVIMRLAARISKLIGDAGAGVISRVMGLILASIATTHVLEGIQSFFGLA